MSLVEPRGGDGAGVPVPIPAPGSVRVGILSDTHGWFHPELPRYLTDCDLILHAGDVGSPEVIERLEEIAPLRVVRGNIDGPYLKRPLPLHDRFEVAGVRFWMTHIAGRPGRWTGAMGPGLRDDPPDVLVCGHSHILCIERVPHLGGMLFLNPGAAGRQGFHQVKTCVILHLEGNKATRADVVHLDP